MPAKEISLNQLKVTGSAGKTLRESLTKNKDYDGSPRGVPAGVKGEARLNTVKVMSSDKGANLWIMVNTSGVVTSPEEFKGRQVYPGYTYDHNVFSSGDEKKADDAVSGMIRFLYNLGIPEDQIEKAKSAKAEDFMYVAVKTIESNIGKNASHFKFTSRAQKKDPSRTEFLAGGPAEVAETVPFTAATETTTTEGTPRIGEVWRYQDVDCKVTQVIATPDEETVNLEPLDGSAEFTDVPWFDADGNPQIEFVR